MLNENGVSDVCLKLVEQRSNLSWNETCLLREEKKCLTFDHPCYESGEVPWYSSTSTAPQSSYSSTTTGPTGFVMCHQLSAM